MEMGMETETVTEKTNYKRGPFLWIPRACIIVGSLGIHTKVTFKVYLAINPPTTKGWLRFAP